MHGEVNWNLFNRMLLGVWFISSLWWSRVFFYATKVSHSAPLAPSPRATEYATISLNAWTKIKVMRSVCKLALSSAWIVEVLVTSLSIIGCKFAFLLVQLPELSFEIWLDISTLVSSVVLYLVEMNHVVVLFSLTRTSIRIWGVQPR